MSAEPSVAEKICLTCGLCCNGVIFGDVQLQRGDNAAKLEALGLPLSRFRSRPTEDGMVTRWRFPQPCAAFDGCHCRIYENRPKYCRAFDCALLKTVKAEKIKIPAALRKISKARALSEKVRQLLRELGDKDEHLALNLRYRRTAQRLQQIGSSKRIAALFSELTLAAHELNFFLSEVFYPGNTAI